MLRICFYSVELNYLDVFFCIFFKIVLLLSTSLLLDFRLAICSLHEIYQVSEAFQVHGKNTHGMSHMHSICRYILCAIYNCRYDTFKCILCYCRQELS